MDMMLDLQNQMEGLKLHITYKPEVNNQVV